MTVHCQVIHILTLLTSAQNFLTRMQLLDFSENQEILGCLYEWLSGGGRLQMSVLCTRVVYQQLL